VGQRQHLHRAAAGPVTFTKTLRAAMIICAAWVRIQAMAAPFREDGDEL